MTSALSRRVLRTLAKRCEATISPGLGGIRPLVSTQSMVTASAAAQAPKSGLDPSPFCETTSTGCSASTKSASPTATELAPTLFCRPKSACWRGRRMSASTTTTFLPARASVTAMLATVTLLPSPCKLLVSMSVLALPSTFMKPRLVRSRRKASDTWSAESTRVTRSGDFICSRERHGTRASMG